VRRVGLLGGLTDEPKAGVAADRIMTIALQLAMPSGSPPGGNMFDWIDTKFGYERERLVLTTMNSLRRCLYVDVDDDDVGDDFEDGGDGDDEYENGEDEDYDEEEGGDGEE